MQTSLLLSSDSNRFLGEFIRKSESLLVWNIEKYLYLKNTLLSYFHFSVIKPNVKPVNKKRKQPSKTGSNPRQKQTLTLPLVPLLKSEPNNYDTVDTSAQGISPLLSTNHTISSLSKQWPRFNSKSLIW